jgi:hypothetical protein
MDTSSQLWSAFLVAFATETPFLVVAIVGVVVAWLKLARTHPSAFLWSVAGLVLIGARSIVGPYGRARTAIAFGSGTRSELVAELAIWNLANYAMLLFAVSCLLIAALSSRQQRGSI